MTALQSQLSARVRIACALTTVAFTACWASAQIQRPGPSVHVPAATTTTPAPLTTAPSTPSQPTSLLELPPKQAVVKASAGNLTIQADNASLTQTLQRVADSTGMQLDGISGDQRVFGNFGPGTPRDVLTALLNGTDYNVIMVGSLANGAPRQLLLSSKTSTAPAAGNPSQPANNSSDDDSTDNPPEDQPAAQPMVPSRPGDGQNGPSGIRTPQQMIQQLQQLHQQQQQQQTSQPQ